MKIKYDTTNPEAAGTLPPKIIGYGCEHCREAFATPEGCEQHEASCSLKPLVMDLLKCGCCGERHNGLIWKPVAQMRVSIKGKAASHFAICPKEQDLILLTEQNWQEKTDPEKENLTWQVGIDPAKDESTIRALHKSGLMAVSVSESEPMPDLLPAILKAAGR